MNARPPSPGFWILIQVVCLLGGCSAGNESGALLGAETAAPGGPPYLAMVALQKVTANHTPHRIEVNSSAVVPHAMVSLGRGDAHLATVIPDFLLQMQKGTGRYSKLENAAEVAANIRLIHSFRAGAYHFVVYADSDVRSFEDFKGKSIFAGPLRGGSATMSRMFIEAGTGYVAGRDYTMVDLDMRGGDAAFMDGHIDILIRTPAIGAAMIEQLGITRDIRLIGFNDRTIDYLENEVRRVGRFLTVIPPGTYNGQANTEPVRTMGFLQLTGVNRSVPEEVVYDITRALWSHLDEFKSVSPELLGSLSPGTAFDGMSGRLHAGAYRYYRETGFDVPPEVLPVESDHGR